MTFKQVEIYDRLRNEVLEFVATFTELHYVTLTVDEYGSLTSFDDHGIWHVLMMPNAWADETGAGVIQIRMPDGYTLSWHQQHDPGHGLPGNRITNLWLGLVTRPEDQIVIRGIGPVTMTDLKQATEDAWNEA